MKFSDIFKKGYGKPETTDVIEGGLCIDISEEKAWSKNDAGVVFQIGLNEAQVTDMLTAFGGLTPIGGIIMYSGQIANIPANWALCDGVGGRPNLIGKFVLGTNIQADIVNKTGGSADAVVIDHTHTNPTHTHTGTTNNDGNHTHDYYDRFEEHLTPDGTNATLDWTTENKIRFKTETRATGGATHAHAFTTAATTFNTLGAVGGVSGTGKNMPPYVALAYIIRVS